MSDDATRIRRTLTRRRVLIGLGLVGGGIVGVGGFLGWRSVTDSRPVTVAGSLPLSGPLETIGVPLHRGLRLWAEEVNERGGLLGRNVTLNIVDDEGKLDVAREAYRSLVDDSQLLVAPYGSRMTGAVMDIIKSAEVPCIAHTAGSRELWTEGREWTVQLLNPIDTFLHSALEVAFQKGARSVAFIYRDDAFTPTTMEGAITKAREQGWTVRDVVVYPSDVEMEQGLDQITEESPDFVVGGGFQPGKAGGGFLPDALALSRAYERAADEAKLVCWSIGASFPAFADTLGAQAEFVTGVTGWKPYVDYPGNQGFIERYRDRWDGIPDSHAAQGYATGQLVEAAAEHAETLDPQPLREALFELQTETVFGRYRVDQRGLQVGKTNVVMQWQGGNPVVVGPDLWKAGELVYPTDGG